MSCAELTAAADAPVLCGHCDRPAAHPSVRACTSSSCPLAHHQRVDASSGRRPGKLSLKFAGRRASLPHPADGPPVRPGGGQSSPSARALHRFTDEGPTS